MPVDLGSIQRHMPELDQARLLAQLQNLLEQIAKRLQVPLAEIRDGPEIWGIERHDAHEIDPFAAGLGDAPRGVDAAAVRIKQQHRHHSRIKRRLAPFAAIGAGDFPETEIVSDQAQHKAGEMVLGHEVPHHRWQKQRLINLPGAECLAHAASWNLTRSSLASKIRLILGRAPSRWKSTCCSSSAISRCRLLTYSAPQLSRCSLSFDPPKKVLIHWNT